MGTSFFSDSVRKAVTKQRTKNECWGGYGGKGTPVHCLRECKVMQLLQKRVWRFLQNFKIDSAVSLLGTYLKKMKILI